MSEKTILIIDDDKRVLHYLEQGLSTLGDNYKVTAAPGASQALAFVQSKRPDLVISDLRMPDMDGLELLRLIRAMHKDTKLVLMTAYGTEQVQEKATEIGVYRFITKPFRTENLLNIARSALSEEEAISLGSDGILIIPDKCLMEINTVLNRLRSELRPDLALMADMAGHVVTHVGTTMGLDLNSIVALVAGNFATASELDRIFERSSLVEKADVDENKPIYITYQEGSHYDCYSANVGNNLFFTVIFTHKEAKNKAGMVWLHIRRTFRELQEIILSHSMKVDGAVLESRDETVTKEFNKLFKDEIEKKI